VIVKALFVLAAALALVAASPANAKTRDPAYAVTITATFDTQRSGLDGGSAAGCTWSAPYQVHDVITYRNAAPLVLRASQLAATQNGLFELQAHETLTATYGQGTEQSCPNGAVPYPDTSGCGLADYKVGSNGTAVGLLNREDRKFTLYFTRIGPDPYGGRCRFSTSEQTPGSAAPVRITNFPPHGRPYWASVSRVDLFSGTPRVVSWSDHGAIANTDYDVSWTVKLAAP
jgi:hypothetical protein